MAFTTLTAFRESTALATAEASATPTIDGAGSAARRGGARAGMWFDCLIHVLTERILPYSTPPPLALLHVAHGRHGMGAPQPSGARGLSTEPRKGAHSHRDRGNGKA